MFQTEEVEIIGFTLFGVIYLILAIIYANKVWNRIENGYDSEISVYLRSNKEYVKKNVSAISLACGIFFPFAFSFMIGCDAGELFYENIIIGKNEEDRFASWFV